MRPLSGAYRCISPRARVAPCFFAGESSCKSQGKIDDGPRKRVMIMSISRIHSTCWRADCIWPLCHYAIVLLFEHVGQFVSDNL
jgi:hypothetical protein